MITPDEPCELDAVRAIFRDYADSLGIDLGFQNFDQELASLPGEYEEPRGALLLAVVDVGEVAVPVDAEPLARAQGQLAHVAGCCALRPLDTADYPNAAEMKRLYVRPTGRGLGLGRTLAESAIRFATVTGYSRMRLDTLPQMDRAQDLYRSLGFMPIEAYRYSAVPGTVFLELVLTTG